MSYNLTLITNNGTGFLSMAHGVNDVLFLGSFFTILMIALAAIMLMGFYNYTGDARRSTATTAIICFVLVLMLRALELVPNVALYISLIAAAVSVVFIPKNR